MKKLDFLIIALAAALSLAPLAFLRKSGVQTVRVTQRDEVLYEGPLSQNAVVTAAGCVITVQDGQARVTEADCPDGLCVKAGAAGPAHPVICLPNELAVTISRAEEAFDGVAY